MQVEYGCPDIVPVTHILTIPYKSSRSCNAQTRRLPNNSHSGRVPHALYPSVSQPMPSTVGITSVRAAAMIAIIGGALLLQPELICPPVRAQVRLAPLPQLPSAGETVSPAADPLQATSPPASAEESSSTENAQSAKSSESAKSSDSTNSAESTESTDELQQMQKELDKRLKELEEQWAEKEKEEKQAEETAAAEAESKPTFETGGRIHLDYWTFPDSEPGLGFLENPDPTSPDFGNDPEDRLLFRRIRLELEGSLPEDMLWRMQVDFNTPSTPEYKDVYFGWEELPGNHSLLIGNQKRPLGLDHYNSSRFNVFAERPLVVEAFNEDARRLGVCLNGYTDDESRAWQAGVFNLENTSITGRYVGDSLQMGGYARLLASPWYTHDGRCYSHWALAGALARPDGDVAPGDSNSSESRFRTRPQARSDARWLDTGPIAGAEWYQILAVENMLNYGPFQWTAEYMANFLQRDVTTPGTGPDVFFHGFYVYGAYFLTGEHMPYDRTSGTLDRVQLHQNFSLADRLRGRPSQGGWGAWQVALRYDFLDLTDQDIAGGIEQNFTLGLNWYWTAYSKLQTNLILGDIREHRPVNGFDGGDFTIIGTRWMCDF